jgi:uncharacterized protein (UPF0332 family)
MSDEALAQARRFLRSADVLLRDSDPASAVSRAYYAAFTVVRCLLEADGVTPKSHAGVHRLFSERFIRAGRVAAAHGAAFQRAWQLREQADYDPDAGPTDAEARQTIRAMADLVRAGEALLTPGS